MKTPQAHPQAIVLAPEIEAVIDVFNSDFKEISFPDVSREALAKAAEAYRSLTREAAAAAATWTALSERAAAAEARLRQVAAQGLAYASIYAAASDNRQPLAATVRELQDRMQVGAPSPHTRGADASPKRRGRKSSNVGETLFPPAAIAGEQTTEFTCETGD